MGSKVLQHDAMHLDIYSLRLACDCEADSQLGKQSN